MFTRKHRRITVLVVAHLLGALLAAGLLLVYGTPANAGQATTRGTFDPVTTTIDALGGTLMVTQGLHITITVGPNIVDGPISLTYEALLIPNHPPTPPWNCWNGVAFTLGVSRDGQPLPSFAFSQPVTITVHNPGDDAHEWALRRWDEAMGQWELAQASCGESPGQRRWSEWIEAPACGVGEFAVSAAAYRFYVPLILREVSP